MTTDTIIHNRALVTAPPKMAAAPRRRRTNAERDFDAHVREAFALITDGIRNDDPALVDLGKLAAETAAHEHADKLPDNYVAVVYQINAYRR